MNKSPLKSNRFLPTVAALLLAILSFNLRLQAQDQPTPDPDPTRFQKEIDNFVENDRKNTYPANAVLFVGSSSIRLWGTGEAFSEFPVINRGFGGSHISDVIHYFEIIVQKYEPAVIVFYAGDNDIAGDKPATHVLKDYVAFAHRIQRELPRTCVIYLPIKPSLARWQLWPEMEKANTMVEAFSDSTDRFYFVDVASPMISDDDGRPLAELFIKDGLHLNQRGYRLWESILRPRLESVYNDCSMK